MASKGKRRRCVFCDQPNKMSAEHVLPDWLNRVLVPGPGYMEQEASGGYHGSSYKRGSYGFDQKIRSVCVPCNTGWMSDLESAARPRMVPLIRGVPHALDHSTQRLLAVWAVKTALVVVARNPYRLRSHYAELYGARQPPHQVEVWIGARAAWNPEGFMHHDLQVAAPDDWRPDRVNGYGTTIFIGHLLLQVVGFELPSEIQRTLKGIAGMALTKIWPIQRPAAPWPPRVIVRRRDLRAIADSVVPGGGTATNPRPFRLGPPE